MIIYALYRKDHFSQQIMTGKKSKDSKIDLKRWNSGEESTLADQIPSFSPNE